ncbi:MAG: MGMT family protein [candidate division WOR-3 bacterium]
METPPKMRKQWVVGQMLIATPRLIDQLIKQIPRGRLATIPMIMDRLAQDHRCTATCPTTTGIFLCIVAEAAEERLKAGVKSVTPYWRVIKADGSLNEKCPGGAAHQAILLQSEGHDIDPSHKTPRVADYKSHLTKL